MKIAEKEFIHYIKRFDSEPFRVVMGNNEQSIGYGSPCFTVIINTPPDLSALMKGTSLALGEAYMTGGIEVDGDLYKALC